VPDRCIALVGDVSLVAPDRGAGGRQKAEGIVVVNFTFGPGLTPHTVRGTDGKVLTVPEGWVLLQPGDAALTRRVKSAGDHWVVQERKGRKVFSQGVWAPAATIEKIRPELVTERSTGGFA